MLTWISEKAKYIIYVFIVGIIAGLIFMDLSQLQTNNAPGVGTVEGVEISNETFNMRLQQIQRQRADQQLTDAQVTQMRNDLFRSFVQQHILEREIKNLRAVASVHEMMRDLRDNPPPGVEQAPIFLTDSVFDPAKWEAWLATDTVYDDPNMLDYEQNLRTQRIPIKQLQLFVNAGFHPSTLEARWQITRRETRYQLTVARLSLDSVESSGYEPDSTEILAYYEAHPDSFLVQNDMAKVQFVALPVRPSDFDEKNTLEFARILLNQLREGADFAEMARLNSEDAGSSTQGGRLGGPTPRGQWVPAFSDAAFALDSGAISEPVRSQFGYHIILSHGKSLVNGEEMVDASHILLKISASTETVDSLVRILQDVRSKVEEGKTMEEVAQGASLPVHTSGFFARGQDIPSLGHVQGLASYAFLSKNLPIRVEEGPVSQVFQNKEWVVFFRKVDSLEAGKASLEPFKDRIRSSLIRNHQLKKAVETLQSKLPLVQTALAGQGDMPPRVQVDSTQWVSAESFVPGLGYATPVLNRVLSKQSPGVWGPVLEGDRASVAVLVRDVQIPDPAKLDTLVREELNSAWRFGVSNLFNEWLQNLEEGAEVENHLDLYFRE